MFVKCWKFGWIFISFFSFMARAFLSFFYESFSDANQLQRWKSPTMGVNLIKSLPKRSVFTLLRYFYNNFVVLHALEEFGRRFYDNFYLAFLFCLMFLLYPRFHNSTQISFLIFSIFFNHNGMCTAINYFSQSSALLTHFWILLYTYRCSFYTSRGGAEWKWNVV